MPRGNDDFHKYIFDTAVAMNRAAAGPTASDPFDRKPGCAICGVDRRPDNVCWHTVQEIRDHVADHTILEIDARAAQERRYIEHGDELVAALRHVDDNHHDEYGNTCPHNCRIRKLLAKVEGKP